MTTLADRGRIPAWLWFLAAAWLACAALIGAANIVYILRHHVTFPFGDQWTLLSRVHRFGLLRGLYMQHNEHRLIVPGLFCIMDYRWFGAGNHFLAIVSLFFQLSCAALLMVPVWRHPAVSWPLRLVFSGAVIVTMLWLIQAEDLFYPFQLQIACAHFAILSIALLLGQAAGSQTGAGLWLAIAGFALWATFSFGSGILIWPVILIVAALLGVPRRRVGAIAVLFLCVVAAYFTGYKTPGGSSSPVDSLQHPAHVAEYMTALLGLPFLGAGTADARFAAHPASYLLTIGGILLAAGLLLVFALNPSLRRRPENVVYGSILLFCLGSAFLAALGRSNFPLEQALSSRYAPMPLIFWISLAALGTIGISRREPAPAGAGTLIWMAVLAVASASAMTFPEHSALGRYMAMRARNQAEVAISMAIGVPDVPRVLQEFGTLSLVTEIDRAAVHDLGHPLFARAETQWLGSPLLGHFQLAPASACLGSVDLVDALAKPSPPGARLLGWAWETGGSQPPPRVWVTDPQGVIRGFGLLQESRPDVAAAYRNAAMEETGWIAYAQLPPGGSPFTVYAGMHDGKSVCPFGAPRSPAP